MQVTVEVVSGLERRMKIAVPAIEVDQEVESRIKKLTKQVKIGGFRPGKVPESLVKQRYGASVRGEVISEVVRKSYVDALEEQKLQPAGDPQMEITTADPGKDLEYVATFEVKPTITLQSPNQLVLESLQAEVQDSDLEQMLSKLQKQQSDWQDVQRPAQIGDRVIVDFDGYMDGEAFDGGSAKNIKLELGSNTMIPGFEDGIVGAKVGDEVEVNVRFPHDYHMEKFADKPAKFTIKLQELAEPKLPELDDKLAEKLGIKEGGIEKLRTEVRANMERELKRTLRNNLKNELLEKFVALNPIELPKVLVHNEIHHLEKQAKQQFTRQTGVEKAPDLPHEHFEPMAKQRVSLGLLFSEFVKENKIAADVDKVRGILEEMASSYQHPEQMIAWYYNNKEQLAQIEALAMEEQVVDALLASAKINYKPASYEEVMNPKNGSKQTEEA